MIDKHTEEKSSEHIEEDVLYEYEYLEESEVYEEYFSPNGEIEIDEDEELEFVEAFPPPPFPFPPNHFGAFPLPPPPPFAEEIEIEEVETEEYDVEYESSYEEEVLVESQSEITEENSDKPEHHQTYAQMNTAQAHAMASVGMEQSVLIRKENGLSRVRAFFKILFGLSVFAGLCGLCYLFIIWNHSQISERDEKIQEESNRTQTKTDDTDKHGFIGKENNPCDSVQSVSSVCQSSSTETVIHELRTNRSWQEAVCMT